MESLGHVQLSVTPWNAAHQAPPSMGFSRQESWSGLPLPSPEVNIAYNLNMQSDSMQPRHNLFPIWKYCVVLHSLLTIASLAATDFLKTGQLIQYSYHFKIFSQFALTHTVKIFGINNEKEVDFFFSLSAALLSL